MKKYFYLIIISLFLFLAVLGALRLLVNGGEDTWLCVDGQWVKHGQPSRPMPVNPCLLEGGK